MQKAISVGLQEQGFARVKITMRAREADSKLRAEHHRFIQRQGITADMCVFVDEVGVVRMWGLLRTGHRVSAWNAWCNVCVLAGASRYPVPDWPLLVWGVVSPTPNIPANATVCSNDGQWATIHVIESPLLFSWIDLVWLLLTWTPQCLGLGFLGLGFRVRV